VDERVQQIAREVVDSMRRRKCWHVTAAPANLSTFELFLGEKVPRDPVLRDYLVARHDRADEADEFEGEANLMVWCTWRLDGKEAPLSSSDDTSEHVAEAMQALVGREALDARVDLPGWDLHLTFSGGLALHVFPDHVPGDPSFSGNWELFLRDKIIAIGVGSTCTIEDRASATPALLPGSEDLTGIGSLAPHP
jgi:hypothetical protein